MYNFNNYPKSDAKLVQKGQKKGAFFYHCCTMLDTPC